jgi:hypothetical protein
MDYVFDGDSRTGRGPHETPVTAWLTLPCSGTMTRVSRIRGRLNVPMSTAVFWLVTAAILLVEGAIIVAALRMRHEESWARDRLRSCGRSYLFPS